MSRLFLMLGRTLVECLVIYFSVLCLIVSTVCKIISVLNKNPVSTNVLLIFCSAFNLQTPHDCKT